MSGRNGTIPGTRRSGHAFSPDSRGYLLLIALMFFVTALFMVPASAAGGNWTQVNLSAGFPERYEQTSVVFDNKMWVIGGLDGSVYYNDTWYSSDGNLWYRAAVSADFPARLSHSSAIFDNKMWVIGGISAAGLQNDVWNSSDGITWKQATASAAFSKRNSQSSVVFDNRMWVIGGTTGSGGLQDVWNSTDGITWNLARASAEFPKRYSHSSVVYHDKIWVIGGYDAATRNDVWYSTDGIGWTQATAAAAFPSRYYHSSVVYDDRMWVVGGLNAAGSVLDDAWSSTDGVTWTKAAPVNTILTREGHSSVVSGSKMWVIGGFGYNTTEGSDKNSNATWSFQASPVAGFSANVTTGAYPLAVAFTNTSSGYPASYSWTFGDGSTSSSESPVHTYVTAGTYSVSLTATNSDGSNTTTRGQYIVVTAPPAPPGISGGDDPPTTYGSSTPSTVTVNAGGNSAVTRATVTGYGLSDLILTGTLQTLPSAIPPPPGSVYQYISLVPARYTAISGALIAFTVPTYWLNGNRISRDTVVLYHYAGTSWEALPTSTGAEKDGSTSFESQGNGFSLFAISGIPGSAGSFAPGGSMSAASGTNPASPTSTTGPVFTASPTLTPPAGADVVQPVTTDPETPLWLVLVAAGVCCGLFAGGILIRRWLVRRQNPALFRKSS